jgi:hypothetical protein
MSLKLHARCGRCDVRMRLSSMPGLKVFACPMCDRVAVIAETLMVGDAYDARMKAQGYRRLR